MLRHGVLCIHIPFRVNIPHQKVAIEKQHQSATIHTNPAVDYIFIINGETRMMDDLHALTRRHANVRVLQRANSCYDGGAIGEVLRDNPDLERSYQYFLLMNSSVRGPFLPVFYSHDRPWTVAFTDLLNDDVKLVGTTISCEISLHIQSMVLATDAVGLELIEAAGALGCPTSAAAAVEMYELPSSEAILDAGYNIASLLARYRGTDWRRYRQVRCNAALNPIGSSDGLPLDPFEVLFVKAKANLQVPTAAFLERYTRYYMRKSDSMSEAETTAELEANAFFEPSAATVVPAAFANDPVASPLSEPNATKPTAPLSTNAKTLQELLASGSLDSVDVIGVGDVARFLETAADSAGRSADFKTRREHLVRSGLKDEDLALEVSPLHSPLLKQGTTTSNIDMRTKDELVEYWKLSDEEAARIPHIHFKWTGGPYTDVLGGRQFKRVVASHVIEHVPCVLTWLESLHGVLEPGGQVRLFVPDVRFTPDYLRRPTYLHEIIGARFEKRTRPTYETVFEHRYYQKVATQGNKAIHDNWARPPQPLPSNVEAFDVESLKVAVEDAQLHFDGVKYLDAHVWKWTPASFSAQMEALHASGLLKLRLETLVPTSPMPAPGLHSTEFFAVFAKD